MESVDLQMEDIFGEQDGDDEDLFTNHAAIPDLPPDEGAEAFAANSQGGEGIENDAVLARLRDLSKGAAKRTVKRVQPKLDTTRLIGDRGIGVLPKVFKDVKFKGKGHEADDLRKVMRYLEHWTHRLFPKMPFDEVLGRIEKLGTKREVQTYIKRMRLDIPVENEENAVEEEVEDIFDTSANETRQSENTKENTSRIGVEEEEVLDELMREEEEHRQSQLSTSVPSTSTCLSTPVTPATQATPTTNTSGGLTAEQLERIEANKRRAQERRLAKLGPKTPGTPTITRPSQVNTPLMYPSTPSVDTSTASVRSQALSASPVVAENKGHNSGSEVPDQTSMEVDELDEDQLLADLENEDLAETASAKTSVEEKIVPTYCETQSADNESHATTSVEDVVPTDSETQPADNDNHATTSVEDGVVPTDSETQPADNDNHATTSVEDEVVPTDSETQPADNDTHSSPCGQRQTEVPSLDTETESTLREPTADLLTKCVEQQDIEEESEPPSLSLLE